MALLDTYAQPADRVTDTRNHLIIQGLDDEDQKRQADAQALEIQRQQNARAQAGEIRANDDNARAASAEARKVQEAAQGRQAAVAAIDARQWATDPNYASAGGYDKLPIEARQHFDTAYPPEVAAKAPEIFNDAVRATSRTIPGLEGMEPVGATTDPATGKTSISLKPRVDPQTTGELTPTQQQLAEAIARYDIPPNQALSRFSQGDREKIMSHAANLGYDAKEYPVRLASRKDFTSGQAARSVTSLNTLIHHFDRVLEAKSKLGNPGSPIVNAPYNYLRKEVGGNSDITAFDTNASAVAEEMAKLLKGGLATKSEIDDWKSKLDRNLAPAQLDANIKEMMQLMAGRVDALRNQWQAAYDKPRDLPFIDKDAQRILKKHGFDPAAVDPGAGGTEPGGNPTPSQAMIDLAKRALSDPAASEAHKAAARKLLGQ